jgi:hypothetical protein
MARVGHSMAPSLLRVSARELVCKVMLDQVIFLLPYQRVPFGGIRDNVNEISQVFGKQNT